MATNLIVRNVHIWGKITANTYRNFIDNRIAAIALLFNALLYNALLYNLTVMTRNSGRFYGTGARVFNPFQGLGVSGVVTEQ